MSEKRKKEIAHRICTELAEPMANFLLNIKAHGKYADNRYTLEQPQKRNWRNIQS